MLTTFTKRSIGGFEFEARELYAGRSVRRWELRKFHEIPWPSDEVLLNNFGDRGFGGKVRRAGRAVMVEVYVD